MNSLNYGKILEHFRTLSGTYSFFKKAFSLSEHRQWVCFPFYSLGWDGSLERKSKAEILWVRSGMQMSSPTPFLLTRTKLRTLILSAFEVLKDLVTLGQPTRPAARDMVFTVAVSLRQGTLSPVCHSRHHLHPITAACVPYIMPLSQPYLTTMLKFSESVKPNPVPGPGMRLCDFAKWFAFLFLIPALTVGIMSFPGHILAVSLMPSYLSPV